MEEALLAILTSNAALTALVGDRVFYLRIAEGETDRPAIVLQQISNAPEYDMDGPAGLTSSRVQIDAYGETYTDAKNAARAAAAAISGFAGTVNGRKISGAFVDGGRDLAVADAGDVNKQFRTSVDVIIWHDGP